MVLVTIDTLRADRLGLYGYPRSTSPFLDRLGKESLVFLNAYSSISHTAPSHTTLFTGLHPAQHQLLRNGEVIREQLITLADYFTVHGYRTAGFTTVNFLEGVSKGFEDFRFNNRFLPSSSILGWAEDWIERLGGGERFFVWIHLFDVHDWYNEKAIDQSARDEMKRRDLSGAGLIDYLAREQGIRHQSFKADPNLLQLQDTYDGQILSVDRELEQFFRGLEERGFADDALWIVTSDHGEGLGNHNFRGHGRYIYEEQLRVPLIVRFGDGRYPAARLETRVRLVDLVPTFAEWIGEPFPQPLASISGVSLVPLIEGATESWGDEVFAQRRPTDERRLREGWEPGNIVALIRGNTKVIVHSNDRHEIYDLENDPFELNNLYEPNRQQQRPVLQQLGKLYAALLEDGERVGSGEIQEQYIEQLKALGYL